MITELEGYVTVRQLINQLLDIPKEEMLLLAFQQEIYGVIPQQRKLVTGTVASEGTPWFTAKAIL
jgi:hypothetical protein